MPKIPDESEFDAALKALQDVAAGSTDPRLAAMVIALQDKNVRELFQGRLKRSQIFSGIDFISGLGIPEESRLVFLFDPPPGELHFIRPLFLVVVNVAEGRVVHIVDPYIPGPMAGAGPRASGMPFTLAVPSAAQRVVVTEHQLAPFRAREDKFFGVSSSARTIATTSPDGTQKGTTTNTLSGTSTREPRSDTVGDNSSDWGVDDYVDQVVDDEHEWEPSPRP